MNTRRFIIAVIVVWIVDMVLAWILNGSILNWEGVPGMKSAAEMGTGSHIFYVIGALVFAFMFCFMFTKGYEGKGIAEGVRYGLYISCLMYLPLLFIYYAYYTYSAGIIWGFTIGNFVITIILGIAAALIYKPKAA